MHKGTFHLSSASLASSSFPPKKSISAFVVREGRVRGKLGEGGFNRFRWRLRVFSMTYFYCIENMISFQLVNNDISIWKQSNKATAWTMLIEHFPPYFYFVTHLWSTLLFLEFASQINRFSLNPDWKLRFFIRHLHSALSSSSLSQNFLSFSLGVSYLLPCSRLKTGGGSRFSQLFQDFKQASSRTKTTWSNPKKASDEGSDVFWWAVRLD